RWDDHSEIERLRREFYDFAKRFPQPATRGSLNIDSIGDFITRCSQSENVFDCSELDQCANCFKVVKGRSCIDCYSWGAGAEFIYNCSRVGTSASQLKCCHLVYSGSAEIEYSMNCFSCQSCFGCIGLRNKQYCILNKQYSKEEYRSLRNQI